MSFLGRVRSNREMFRRGKFLVDEWVKSPLGMIRVDVIAEKMEEAAKVFEAEGKLETALAFRQFSAALQEWAVAWRDLGGPKNR